MTHKAGIEAALRASDAVPPMSYFLSVSDRQDAVIEAIIEAYLSASGQEIAPAGLTAKAAILANEVMNQHRTIQALKSNMKGEQHDA